MLRDIRNNYQQRELLETEVYANPLDQFRFWLNEAIAEKVHEPTAMVLSTVDSKNSPHARVVLLKDLTSEGFVFFTNYNSAKAAHISGNKYVSLTFFWPEQERQVRIGGCIKKVSKSISDDYFASRPIDSQLGAWASPQSRKIESKKVLEDNFSLYRTKFEHNIPRPKNWGGYLIEPSQIEFWQGRPNRLHDRIRYEHDKKMWNIVRLAP